MRSVALKLEAIHDDKIDKLYHARHGRVRMGRQEMAGAKGKLGRRPFVKRVTGVTPQGVPIKKSVGGKKSYKDAVGTGARGVYYNWILRHGECYQVQRAISRRKARKYFIIIIDGSTHEISQTEVALYVSGKISLTP